MVIIVFVCYVELFLFGNRLEFVGYFDVKFYWFVGFYLNFDEIVDRFIKYGFFFFCLVLKIKCKLIIDKEFVWVDRYEWDGVFVSSSWCEMGCGDSWLFWVNLS